MTVINVCKTDFAKAVISLGMNEEEANALFDEARSAALARAEQRLTPRAEALNMSFEELIADREAKQRIARRQTLMNVIKYHGAIKQIKVFDNASHGLVAFLGGVESNLPKSRVSVVNQITSDTRAVKSYMILDLKKNNVEKLFETKGIDDELASELEKPGTSKNPEITTLAKVIKKHQGALAKSLNEHGADIQVTDDYIAKLKWNSRRMKSATGFGLKDAKLRAQLLFKHKGDWKKVNEEFKKIAFDRWKNTVQPLTDKDTFARIATEDQDRFYKSFYQAVVTGVHKVPYLDTRRMEAGPHPLITRIGSNIANKLSQGRVLKLNEGGWVKVNKTYGYDTIHDAVVRQFEEGGKALGIMKKAGSSPRHFLMRLHRTVQEMGETRDMPNFKRNMKHAQNLIKTLLGDMDQPMEGLAGEAFRTFRIAQYASKTGGIVLSSIPDLGNMTSALRQHGYSPIDVYGEAVTNLAKGLPTGARKELGLHLRIYSDGTIGGLMNKFGDVDTPYGWFAKGMKLQDKWSLINRWDNVNRFTMGYLLSNKMATNIDIAFDKLLPSQRRTFEISGIDEKMWRLIQANKDSFMTIDKMKFAHPDIVDDFSDESIAQIYYGNKSPKTTPIKLRNAKEAVRESLAIFFTDQTAYGKVLPNLSDRALMNGGVAANTWAGSFWRLLTMFHSFHVAATRRTLARFLYGNGAENLYDALIKGKADFKGLGNYMLQTLPLGYLSYTSKFMARGLMPPSLKDKKTWAESAVRGGMFMIYGSYFADAFDTQHEFLSSVAGPGIKTINDVVNLLRQIVEGKNPAKSAIWLAQGNLPFINLFYLKMALDHALLNAIHTKVDPTYKYKLLQRAAKNNQHYLWAP